MSLDNVIAIAAAADGNILLIGLGLAMSVPLIIYGSTLILNVFIRYPILIVARRRADRLDRGRDLAQRSGDRRVDARADRDPRRLARNGLGRGRSRCSWSSWARLIAARAEQKKDRSRSTSRAESTNDAAETQPAGSGRRFSGRRTGGGLCDHAWPAGAWRIRSISSTCSTRFRARSRRSSEARPSRAITTTRG